jgi:2'-5' RNA ligase
MTEKIRTFIAINIPDHVREAIDGFQKKLKEYSADVKWVRPESIHITLKFLGDVEIGRIDKMAHAVQDAVNDVEPFTISVSGVGTFPNDRRPRVLWVGVQEGAETLSDLAKKIDHALSTMGFEKEKRKYSAHLTLGRVRSPNYIDKTVRDMRSMGFESESFAVGSIEVMKSQLLKTGAVYTALHHIKFKGAS